MRIVKKIVIICISFMLMFMMTNPMISNARVTAPAGGGSSASGDIYEEIKTLAGSEVSGGAVSSANNMAGAIISIAKVICAGVAIIMITVIAMKYMLAAPSEKADIKKHAVVYVVGAIVMFAATAILQIIQDFATTAISEKA